MKLTAKYFSSFLLIASAILLVVFLWWHWRVGMVRYFDVDEFAHLHWADRIAMGKRPYIDFLTFFPPGFHWFLAPFFLVGAGGTWPLFAGRVTAFFIFVGLSGAAAVLFYQMRPIAWGAVLVAAILAFLPLPFDKFLEIRPDNLATLLTLLGMIFQIQWMRKGAGRDGFLAGMWYSLSLIVLSKTLPVVGVAVSVAVFHSCTSIRGLARTLWNSNLKIFFFGLTAPLFLFGLWLLSLGNLPLVIYSLTKLPLEANHISFMFPMQPDLFFYPNETFYGASGWWAQGLIVNHILWVVGLLFGLYRLLTPFWRGKAYAWEEILVAGTFFLQAILFIQFIPLKHTQYLIPIAVFIAWYVADLVVTLGERMRQMRPIWRVGFMVVFAATSVVLYQIFLRTNTPKLNWTSADSFGAVEKVFAAVPHSAYVFDLDGRTLYYEDPYYICCLPFGEFTPYLSLRLPSVADALERTHTKYIYQGGLKRIQSLSSNDQAYIAAHFAPLDDSEEILVRK